jgi:hypothetical protein
MGRKKNYLTKQKKNVNNVKYLKKLYFFVFSLKSENFEPKIHLIPVKTDILWKKILKEQEIRL